ncbi:RluA family pseudouridine synthase [bacterium]|nr:RluA family pseudouridine synthase [bacterium]
MTIHPLYLDNHLLVVCKPAGILIQSDITGDLSLLEAARHYLKETFDKPGNVFLGMVHRLDRPVSGVVVFAKTSKAASRLSDQFRKKTVEKKYWALVEGKPPKSGVLSNRIVREGVNSRITNETIGKEADLSFRRILYSNNTSLIEIVLGTGRHHQIRVQLAHIGFPIIGDFRYGSKVKFPNRALALHARSVTINHPVRGKRMIFVAPLDTIWPEEVKNIQTG